jgi:hypothetical protein
MPNGVAESNEQTFVALGMLSFDGLLPRFAVVEEQKAQEAESTLREED